MDPASTANGIASLFLNIVWLIFHIILPCWIGWEIIKTVKLMFQRTLGYLDKTKISDILFLGGFLALNLIGLALYHGYL